MSVAGIELHFDIIMSRRNERIVYFLNTRAVRAYGVVLARYNEYGEIVIKRRKPLWAVYGYQEIEQVSVTGCGEKESAVFVVDILSVVSQSNGVLCGRHLLL